jgi:hypothetical protein
MNIKRIIGLGLAATLINAEILKCEKSNQGIGHLQR